MTQKRSFIPPIPCSLDNHSLFTMSHQFNITTSERRASTSIAGSLGRPGLFIPQDFIQHSQREINEALEIMDDEDDEVLPIATSNPRLRAPSIRKPLLQEEADLLQENNIHLQQTYTSINDDDTNADLISSSWDDAIKSGKITTTTWFEIKSLSLTSVPLIVTFLLQNSLAVCSIFAVGHISSEALAGISIATMTSNITAMAPIAGLASSLDTFLPQAYGAKKYHLVGLIFQRCTLLIMFILTFICTCWWIYAETALTYLIPDKVAAQYAAQYLKVTSFGIPGYILFETGKRYLQSQEIFDASTYVLFVCAPLNAIMNFTFVWTLGFGYIGAPMAVAINYNLMALGLFLYTITTKDKTNPMKCWNGFQIKKALTNWGELIKLSIPNLIMIVSEFLSFEIMTLMSSYLGTTSLAAQSILSTIASLTYQVPYGVSIAASTRIANFLGAKLPQSAFITCKATFYFTVATAILNSSFIFLGRSFIANWFTNEQDVIHLVYLTCPIVAFMQLFDVVNAVTAGCLRGQGTQKIGGIANLTSYYLVGLPLAFYLAFYYPTVDAPLGLTGLWTGITVALLIIAVVQSYFTLNADFDQLVEDAQRRANSE